MKLENFGLWVLAFIVAGFIFLLIAVPQLLLSLPCQLKLKGKSKTVIKTRNVQKGFIQVQMKDGTELKGPEVLGYAFSNGTTHLSGLQGFAYQDATEILNNRIESLNNSERLLFTLDDFNYYKRSEIKSISLFIEPHEVIYTVEVWE